MNVDLFAAGSPLKRGKQSRHGGARVAMGAQHDSTVRQLRPSKEVHHERENAFID